MGNFLKHLAIFSGHTDYDRFDWMKICVIRILKNLYRLGTESFTGHVLTTGDG